MTTSTTARALATCREGRAVWRERAERAESAIERDLSVPTATIAIVAPAPAAEAPPLFDAPAVALIVVLGLAVLGAAFGGGVAVRSALP